MNTVHPDAVFDTALWTDDMLASRASHYNMTVEEYKAKNLLKTEITSRDVAQLVAAMAGPLSPKPPAHKSPSTAATSGSSNTMAGNAVILPNKCVWPLGDWCFTAGRPGLD